MVFVNCLSKHAELKFAQLNCASFSSEFKTFLSYGSLRMIKLLNKQYDIIEINNIRQFTQSPPKISLILNP